jgi:hypothetical protein
VSVLRETARASVGKAVFSGASAWLLLGKFKKAMMATHILLSKLNINSNQEIGYFIANRMAF